MTVDPITADVIGHRFQAATDEMLATLVKTAFSPNVKERRDCSAACFDVNGDLVSLSASAPMHLCSLMGMVQNIVKRFPLQSIRPGDIGALQAEPQWQRKRQHSLPDGHTRDHLFNQVGRRLDRA